MSTRNENGAIRQTNNGAGEVEASIMKNEEDLRDMLDDVQHRVLAKLFSLFAQKADDVDSIGPDNYFEATDDEKAKLRSVASAIFQGICTVTGGVICIDINSMGTRRKTIVMDLLCKELHPSSSLDGVSPGRRKASQCFSGFNSVFRCLLKIRRSPGYSYPDICLPSPCLEACPSPCGRGLLL